jgi:hypothetical protein
MMNEARNMNMNQTYANRHRKYCTRSNGGELITLMNKFLEITRKEWLIMNEARNIDLMDPAYEKYWNETPERPSGAEIITLVSKKPMSIEYLNEKLAYFYNNGGPIMDI